MVGSPAFTGDPKSKCWMHRKLTVRRGKKAPLEMPVMIKTSGIRPTRNNYFTEIEWVKPHSNKVFTLNEWAYSLRKITYNRRKLP